MSAKKTLLNTSFVSTVALSLVLSAGISANAQAQDSTVSTIVSSMMQNVITSTSNEIDLHIQKSIIQIGHSASISTDDLLLPATRATITDLASIEPTNADITNADVNTRQSEQAND